MTSNYSRRTGDRLEPGPKRSEEQSAVRKRDSGRPGTEPARVNQAPISSIAETAIRRNERIEHKLRLSRILLQDLPASDARSRLLELAIMRRDEVLLDGVLELLMRPRERV
jgi:hypothetical protein